MPPRPNDLQQLIRLVERQLAGGGRVAEWLLFAGRDGTPREVDAVIEAVAGERAVRVALEYRDGARPADVGWVEQLRAKYHDLAVDQIAAVAAVAKRGFTPAARARAAAYGIRALSLAEARAEDWARALARLAAAAPPVPDSLPDPVPDPVRN